MKAVLSGIGVRGYKAPPKPEASTERESKLQNRAESPDPSRFGTVQESPDEFELTRKVVCEVPGEGQVVLIYSNFLYHNGRVIRELGPVSRPAFPKYEILDCRFPDGSIIGTTPDRCAGAGGQLQTPDATSSAKE